MVLVVCWTEEGRGGGGVGVGGGAGGRVVRDWCERWDWGGIEMDKE